MSNNSLMKRIMALLLVIVLCIGLLPANALAEGLAGDADAAEVTTSVQTDAEAADASEPAEPADSQAEEAASEEAYPAQEFEATIEETGLTVKVEAPEGALPENTELVLSDVDDQAAKDAAVAATGDENAQPVAAVGVSFEVDGQKVEPQAPVDVTLESDQIAEVTEEDVLTVIQAEDPQVEDDVIVEVDLDTAAPVDEQDAEVEINTEDGAVQLTAENPAVLVVVDQSQEAGEDEQQPAGDAGEDAAQAENTDNGDEAQAPAETAATEPAAPQQETKAPADQAQQTEEPVQEPAEEEAVVEEPAPVEEVVEAPAAEEPVAYTTMPFMGTTENGVSVLVTYKGEAFYEGTEMVVTDVAVSDVEDTALDLAGADTQVMAAVDISFYYQGTEIEPMAPITVTMNSPDINVGNEPTLIHIPDEKPAEIVPYETVTNGAREELMQFTAEEFSIYVVAGQKIVTVNFYDENGDLVNTQYIKKVDDSVQDLYNPTWELEYGTEFYGWSTEPGATTGSNIMQVNEAIESGWGDSAENAINYYAVVQKVYVVTFNRYNDEGHLVVLDTIKMPIDQADKTIIIPGDLGTKLGDKFQGWLAQDGTVYEKNTSYTVTGHTSFYLKEQGYAWLVFDSNAGGPGSGATYTPPQLIFGEGVVTEKPADPTRTGYSFLGWNTEADGSGTWWSKTDDEPVDGFGTAINNDVTLYAQWEGDQTSYYVIYWQQSASDAAGLADSAKTYVYAGSDARTAKTGDGVSTERSDTTKGGTVGSEYGYFFTYNAANSDTTATVAADGTTTLNVYYDRRTITYNFVSPTAQTAQNGQYGFVDGEYVQLYYRQGRPGWYNYYPVGNNDSHATVYYSTGNYYYEYSATRFTDNTGTTTASFSGLYGSAFTEWPEAGNNQTWSYGGYRFPLALTVFDPVAAYNGDDPSSFTETTITFTVTPYGTGNNKLYVYVQTETGEWSYTEDYLLTTATLGGASTWYPTETFTGFEIQGYQVGASIRKNEQNWTQVSSTGSIEYGENQNIYLRYSRNQHKLTYISQGENTNVRTEHVVAGIYYDASLSGYANYEPNNGKDGFAFAGWYADENCNVPFDFTTAKMGDADVTVYAKWETQRCRVVLNPNAPEGEYSFANNQALTFRLDYNEKLDGSNITGSAAKRPGYVLDHWTVDGTSNQWNFDTLINSAVQGVNSQYQDTADWTNNVYGDNDGAHDNVVNILKLKAHWKLNVDENSVYVVYQVGDAYCVYNASGDLQTQIPVDNYAYVLGDGATSVTFQLAGVPSGYNDGYDFKDWALLNADGTKSGTTGQPTSLRTISSEYFKEETITDDDRESATIRYVVFEAEFTPKVERATTVVFDGNGGTTSDGAATVEQSYLVNKTFDIPENMFTRNGYTFVEWNTKADGSGTKFEADTTVAADNLTGDAWDAGAQQNILYAVWSTEIHAVITGSTETVTYNGQKQTNRGYTVKYYDDNNDEITTLPSGVTFTPIVNDASGTDAGTYTGTVTGTLSSTNPLYTVRETEPVVVELTITPAPVTVKADDKSKVYGEADPALTATVTGLVNGEAESLISYTLSRDAGKNVGTYTITATGAETQGNYTVSYVPGTFTITKAGNNEIIVPTYEENGVQANGGKWVYDGTSHTGEARATQDGSTLTYIVGDETLTAAPSITDVGSKTVKVIATNPNYADVEATYTLTVNPRSVTLTSATDSKTYDGTALTNSNVTVSEDGFVTGEGATYSFTGTQTLVGSSDNTFTYALNNGTKADNYTITTINGILTVTDGTNPPDPEGPPVLPVKDDLVVTKADHNAPPSETEGSTPNVIKYNPGDIVTFDITATNIYDAEPKTITLSEIEGVTLARSTFENVEPGATVETTATYTVTEQDIINGSFTNTVTATVGNLTKTANTKINVADLDTDLTVKKTISNTPPDGKAFKFGETIQYTITVKNDGNVTYKDVVVNDQVGDETITRVPGIQNVTVEKAKPAAESETEPSTDTGTETESGTDAGTETGTEVTSGGGGVPTPLPIDIEDLDVPPAPVEGNDTDAEAGTGSNDSYTINIDEETGIAVVTIKSIAPGESYIINADYRVTEADILAGEVTNTAVATAEPIPDPQNPGTSKTPEGDDTVTTGDEGTPDDPDDPPTPPIEEPNGHLTITKTTTSTPASGGTYKQDETITYKITVKNDGNLTITNIIVTDKLAGVQIAPSAADEDGKTAYTVNENGTVSIASIAPKESVDITATYTVTAADVTATKVTNVATATGTSPDPNQKDVPVKDGEKEDPTGTTPSGGGGGGPVIIPDDDVPLAPIPDALNGEDHFAYVKGYPDQTVRPEGNITRAETATMIYRLLKPVWRDIVFTDENSFSDVEKSDWFNKAVSSMANGEYILGYPDGTFLGGKTITRAEFVTIMIRFLGEDPIEENPFTDIGNHWAKDYILTAVGAGWIDGYPDGTFQPNALITRAEAMKIINSVLHRGVNETSELGNFINFPDNEAGKWYYYEVLEAVNDHEHEGERPNENWTSNSVDYFYDIVKYEHPGA